MSEHPPPDPAKLLAYWTEWEKGEVSPGQVMSNLKRGGLPEILEAIVESARAEVEGSGEPAPSS